jgi:hypothetical protein
MEMTEAEMEAALAAAKLAAAKWEFRLKRRKLSDETEITTTDVSDKPVSTK